MQHPASQPVINPNSIDINVEEYVAPRFLRKLKSKVTKIEPLVTHNYSAAKMTLFPEFLQLRAAVSAR
jgi:hypothetical protein